MLHDLEHAVRHGLKVDQIAAAPRSGAQAQTACGGASLATIRRLTLSLLREDTSLKRSVKAKRFACVLDLNDLLQVFQQAQIDAQDLVCHSTQPRQMKQGIGPGRTPFAVYGHNDHDVFVVIRRIRANPSADHMFHSCLAGTPLMHLIIDPCQFLLLVHPQSR